MKQAVSIFALTVLLASTMVNGLPVLSNKRQDGNQVGQNKQQNVDGDNVSNQNQIMAPVPNAEHFSNAGGLPEPDNDPKMPQNEHLMNNGMLMEPENSKMPATEHLMNNGMLMEPDNAKMPGSEHLVNNGLLMEPSR